jgi:formylglycine-generating enzyme
MMEDVRQIGCAVEMPGMRYMPGGIFSMGSDKFYPEEWPVRKVHVDPFWIDEAPVTNREFAAFVAATGHVTLAEMAPDPADYPSLLPAMARAGSMVFEPPTRPVPLNDVTQWWHFRFGADWCHPHGPGSTIEGLGDHPVVHVAYSDALAYATWSGKDLPTEAEWEFAARAGLDGAEFAWGNQLAPQGTLLANYWQGNFPHQNLRLDGWEGTSPVRAFPANDYGLFDMIGNVREWTCDWYSLADSTAKPGGGCCIPKNPRGGAEGGDSYDPALPDIHIGRKVLKGGSHLCAPNYCQRYRPAARYAQTIDTSTSHIGLRCVVRSHQ